MKCALFSYVDLYVCSNDTQYVCVLIGLCPMLALALSSSVGHFMNNACPNLSPPGQNGNHFEDNIFKCIFLNEYAWILMQISLKCDPN